MTIDKAIEILNRAAPPRDSFEWPEWLEAKGLGVEALRLLDIFRKCLFDLSAEKLPGETEK